MLGDAAHFNFQYANKVQKKYSPLYQKRIAQSWQSQIASILPDYVEPALVDAFNQATAINAAEFCLEMYRRMQLLDGIEVLRSSDPNFRRAAREVSDFFVDVHYNGEIVRARWTDGTLKLHKGGDSFITLPEMSFSSEQISPTRDTRLRWMQSVIHCTHYVTGASEKLYLHQDEAPEITYIERDPIDLSEEAYAEL